MTSECEEDVFRNIHNLLASNSTNVRSHGQALLMSLSNDGVTAYLAYERRTQIECRIHIALAILVTFIVLFSVIELLEFPVAVLAAMVPAGAIGAKLWSRSYVRALTELAKGRTMYGISDLLCALKVPDRALHVQLLKGLPAKLTRLTEDDYPLINDEARRMALQWLAGYYRQKVPRGEVEGLDIALLDALSRVGDARFLPVVLDISQGRLHGYSSAVREAADRCYPILHMIINMRNAGAQLLRPSSSDAIDFEELVRPASQSI